MKFNDATNIPRHLDHPAPPSHGRQDASPVVRRSARSFQANANEQLRGELTAIGSALGGLTGSRRGRGRRLAAALALPATPERRKRKPITDPDVLARRAAALVRARAARAETLAAAPEAVVTNG